MKISGFSIVKNARKYGYPVVESVHSILPICDEFIMNVGKSDDDTLDLVRSINSDKLKIIETDWDPSQKPDVLTYQTNLALSECSGDWAFYLQSDEVIHENDLPVLRRFMDRHLNDPRVDAFRFCWLHFYGSYYRYRIVRGWFQKQDRIIRNNGQVESCVDAWAFHRNDGQPLRTKKTGCLLYHYGWVQPADIMTQRRVNSEYLWAKPELSDEEKQQRYSYGDLNRFAPYFGSHPAVMKEVVEKHGLSQRDRKEINRHYWWHPCNILRLRYKTHNRIRHRLTEEWRE